METTNYEKFFPNCNIDYVKDEKHWHQLRGKGIGGSDAGIAMNVNNYKTPYELWEEKTGVKKPVFQTSEAIEKGNALEPILIELFGVLYKNKFELIDTKDISLSNKKYPFLRANLDGAMIEIATKEKWGLEIKSTTIQNGAMLKEWTNDHIPICYYFQVLHYMITTGLRHFVLYAILDIPWANNGAGKQETRVVYLHYDDLVLDAKYLFKTELWYWNLIKTKTPPPFLENRNKELKEVS